MAEYKHGAYSVIDVESNKLAASAGAAYVYVGTAPVGHVSGGTTRVNTPILVHNIAEAKALFGYSDDWASYTLCEPMHAHLELNGVGPLVLINVLDPAKHKGESVSTKVTFTKGRAFVPAANIVLDTLKLRRPFEDYEKQGYIKTAKDCETVFKKIGGKDVTGKVLGEQVFYYIFDKTPDKGTDLLMEIEADGKKYGCLDLGSKRAESVTILYFSLNLGDHDFIDGKADKTVKDLSSYTGDVTMTLYSCKGTDQTTYPSDLQVIDKVTMHMEAGDSQQYYKLGSDYTANFSAAKNGLEIQAIRSAMPAEIDTSYDNDDPAQVTAEDVIGTDDGLGLYTGLQAVKAVYQQRYVIPSFIAAPGFSTDPKVHDAMLSVANKINNHWDAYVYADLPLVDKDNDNEPLTLVSAHIWKQEHGYTSSSESVYFPMAIGTDDHYYHISVLAAANAQTLLRQNGGRPYMSPSNTACDIIQNLWLGAENVGRVFDDYIINENLNRYGIDSAAFLGGTWRIWGAHAADYDADNPDMVAVSETNRMMLYWLGNDFQARRSQNIDKPISAGGLASIVSEEQARLDALVKAGALTYGKVIINADEIAMSDMYFGDFSFAFDITTTPLAKSLTAIVTWTDDGFVTFYAGLNDLKGE